MSNRRYPRTTKGFISALKKRYKLPSDYAVAKLLEIRKQTASRYQTQHAFFNEDIALRVAESLDLPPEYVLVCVAAERTKITTIKQAWHRAAADIMQAEHSI